MIKIVDLRQQQFPLSHSQLSKLFFRSEHMGGNIVSQVESMITRIKHEGVDAAQEYTAQFDQVDLSQIRVSETDIAKALEQADHKLIQSLKVAIERVRTVHSDQLPHNIMTQLAPGATVYQRWQPIERVGLYIPGGRAVYPSSVIMNVIPAQVAGVKSLVVCSPPQKEFHSLPHPSILATCALLGVEHVWAVGGVAAIGLMAYGAIDTTGEELVPVQMITGPGNMYVATAKRLVSSFVGVDTEAGPTEILILADDSANAEFVAWDLISQAEHDPLAASILITTSEKLAYQVRDRVSNLSHTLPHKDRIMQALAGDQSGIFIVPTMEAGIELTNYYASEHVEIHTRDAQEISKQIVNAGAIFIGDYSPVPLGDYAAGSNHVLPTSAHARFQSGLSTRTFMKLMNIVEYDRLALANIGQDIIQIADTENLPAHGKSIAVRMGNGSDT